MMKQEFEALAGIKVGWHDYKNIIEPMYYATNLTKRDFVRTINVKAFDIGEDPKDMTYVSVTVPTAWGVCEVLARLTDIRISDAKPVIEALDPDTYRRAEENPWDYIPLRHCHIDDCRPKGGRKRFLKKTEKLYRRGIEF